MAPASIQVRQGASKAADAARAVDELFEAIHQPDAVLYVFFSAPSHDLEALERAIKHRFGSAPVIGCTTAGEITPFGYLEGSLTGVSIAGALRISSVRIDDLVHFEFARGDRAAHTALQRLQATTQPSGRDTFGLLISDGLSMQEEALVASLGMHVNQTFTGVALGASDWRRTGAHDAR